MDAVDTAERMLNHIPHKRQRTGIANPDSNGYVRFTYACKPNCPRCAFTSEVSALVRDRQRQRSKCDEQR